MDKQQEQKIRQMITEVVKREMDSKERTKSDFRQWVKHDSVTDKFSPITGNSGQIGFYGTTKQSKQTVTGSKGANAALTSLLTALSTIGLITDSSS